MKKLILNRSVVFSSIGLVLSIGVFFFVAGCEPPHVPAACKKSIKRYFYLLTKEQWEAEDKAEFVDLFTLRGLNQFLDSLKLHSFAEFEQKRLSIYGRFGKISLVGGPSRSSWLEIGDEIDVTWKTNGSGEFREYYFMSQFVFSKQENKIYNIQTKEAEANRAFRVGLLPVKVIYPGPPSGNIYTGVRQLMDAELNQLLSSQNNAKMAISFKNEALKYSAQNDRENYQIAVAYLYKSLSFQYDADTAIELAYCLSGLGRSGINPGLNYLRARAVLQKVQNNRLAARSTAVNIINYFNAGIAKEAERLKESLDVAILREGAEDKYGSYNRLDQDQRVLEAKYLLEIDWSKRIALAEALILIDPNNPKYYNFKGLACYHSGDMSLAEESFKRAVAINSKFTEARANLLAMQQQRIPELDIAPALEEKWEAEPENFPFRAVVIYADLLSPPSSASALVGQ